jgi:hypothetical protein
MKPVYEKRRLGGKDKIPRNIMELQEKHWTKDDPLGFSGSRRAIPKSGSGLVFAKAARPGFQDLLKSSSIFL